VPTGSRVVGTRLLSLTDPNYADPYLANGTPRELMVRLWYPAPAAATKGCARADYAPRQVWEHFSSLLGVALPQVSTHSCLDAFVDAGTHPVVVLTHGFTGTFTDYTFLAEDLASRGYIVASVNHTFEATATELADGRLQKSVYGSHLNRYTRYDADALSQAVTVRLHDLRFVLDQLAVLNRAPGGPFANHLDLEHVALAGHSLGGLTTLRELATEPRFKAGIVLDGALSPQPLQSVRQPVLAVMASVEPADPDECRMWNALRGPRMAVALPGVEHVALSDAVWIAGTAIRTGSAGPDQVVSSVRRHIAGFLDATFKGLSAEQAVVAARASFPGAWVATGAQLTCRAQ
jgi:predicted dienelactone hydrolase